MTPVRIHRAISSRRTGFLLLSFLSVISLCTSNYPRPLLISLPMTIGMGPMGRPPHEEGSSAEEQRLAPRAYDPGQQQQSSERGPFLSWGGGQSPFMVLQLSDYISGTTQQQSQQDQSEEEFEKVEDTRDRKRHRRPPQQPQQRHQGAYDFDDFQRLPERRPDNIEIGKKPKKKKKQMMTTTQARSPDPEGDEEDEEREGEVYGTDPVVHYLREKKKGRRRYKIVEDDEEDFPNLKDWWQY